MKPIQQLIDALVKAGAFADSSFIVTMPEGEMAIVTEIRIHHDPRIFIETPQGDFKLSP